MTDDNPDDNSDDDPDVALVRAAYRAFAAGDIDGAVADLAPDVVWIEPDSFPNGGRHDGPAAVARYLQASYDSWSSLHSQAHVQRIAPGVVAVVHQFGGIMADGTPHVGIAADVFTIEGGTVVRMQAYADPAELDGLRLD